MTHLVPPLLRGGVPVILNKSWCILFGRAKNLKCNTKCLIFWSWLRRIVTQYTTVKKLLAILSYIFGGYVIINQCQALQSYLLFIAHPCPATVPPTPAAPSNPSITSLTQSPPSPSMTPTHPSASLTDFPPLSINLSSVSDAFLVSVCHQRLENISRLFHVTSKYSL